MRARELKLRDRHAEPAAENGYSEAQRAKVGQEGDWKTLELPASRDIRAAAPTPKTEIAEARARLEKTETAKSPLGEELEFGAAAKKHLYKEGRSQKQINQKLQALDQARATIEAPHEIWLDPATGRRKHVRIEAQPRGREVINVVDTVGGQVYSWHTNSTSLDHYRNGRLLYVRG